MTPSAATQPSARAGRPRPLPGVLLALLAPLAACAGEANYTPGDLDRDQMARCRAVAQAYVDGAPEYPELRDALRSDPVAIRWFVRYLEHEIVRVREGRAELESEEVVRIDQVKLRRDREKAEWNLPGQRPDSRAVDQVVAIGEPAVEVVMQDLLLSGQEFLRSIGVELLAGIGDAAVPRLLRLVREGEPAQQRVAARALGAIGAAGPALAALRELSRSSEWRVRSSVAGALGSGGPEARDLLIRMLGDDDGFVRRKAAEALARHREPVAARALVDHLDDCKRREDFEGELAVQQALQALAGTRGPRTSAAWRRFVAELEAAEGGR